LWFKYNLGREYALKGINLSIEEGEMVGVIGPNGSGKTTLCLTLNGIIPHLLPGEFKGQVVVCGINTLEHSVPEIAQNVGIVFSEPDFQISQLTVEDEIMFGPANLGVPRHEIESRMRDVIEVLGLKGLEKRPPHTLSGGQKQRLAIASVLSMRPKVLVLDEPTTQLDPAGTEEVFQAIKALKERGVTIVVVEHKIDFLAEYADRIVLLYKGRVVLDGRPKEVFSDIDTIVGCNMGLPEVTEIFHLLKKKGLYGKKELPVTLEEAYDEILDSW